MPLLIGGATTSRRHTAVKIAPQYQHGVIHVLDASRAVPVASGLLEQQSRAQLLREIHGEYSTIRETHQAGESERVFVTLAEARENRQKSEWHSVAITTPNQLGIQVFENFPIQTLRQFIDWSPFFSAWELKGKYPEILKSPKYGKAAQSLFQDAQSMLDQFVASPEISPTGVIGLFAANSVNYDDIEIYDDDSRTQVLTTLYTLRQQSAKRSGVSNLALADFIAPKESGVKDYIGAFAVTTGVGVEVLAKHYQTELDDYRSILVKALADRLAEAFAECLHQMVRKQIWGYAKDENLSNDELVREKYSGVRPAPGYPACPDHTEKKTLFDLIRATEHTGITLTESYAMHPGASVSGFYFAHPTSKYFGLGKIERDQILDYAQRKALSVSEVERWLSPNLSYDPDEIS